MALQNTSHAVMAQRAEPRDSLDDFPTPPWATRALIEHVISRPAPWFTAWDPACNRGFMARPLREYFGHVFASDIADYGEHVVSDFLRDDYIAPRPHWIITNPPFRLAENFIEHALGLAFTGVAMLVRTSFLEGVGRYERLFSKRPPAIIAPFVERVPMVKGRCDPAASTATAYCWLVWHVQAAAAAPRVVWIPPCRKQLEREGDYA